MLAGLFERRDFRDPELAEAQITVTEVRIGPDLKHAIAFVARLGRSDIDALLPALKRAAPFLRSQVAHALPLKFAPDLSFQPDTRWITRRRSTGCCTGPRWRATSAARTEQRRRILPCQPCASVFAQRAV